MRRGTDRTIPRRSRKLEPEGACSRGDDGLTLVELLVAIAVIVIVLVPTTIFVVQAQTTVSSEHLRAEAVNLATRELETLQLEASKGTLPTGTATTIYPVGETGPRVTDFKVTTSWTVVAAGDQPVHLCFGRLDSPADLARDRGRDLAQDARSLTGRPDH